MTAVAWPSICCTTLTVAPALMGSRRRGVPKVDSGHGSSQPAEGPAQERRRSLIKRHGSPNGGGGVGSHSSRHDPRRIPHRRWGFRYRHWSAGLVVCEPVAEYLLAQGPPERRGYVSFAEPVAIGADVTVLDWRIATTSRQPAIAHSFAN
jgi:hypothetical protein